MLPVRTTPLPSAVEYSLDNAFETNEIDACTNNVLRLYGAPPRLSAIIGPPISLEQATEALRNETVAQAHQNTIRNRFRLSRELIAYADELLPKLDNKRRGAMVYDGLRGLLSYQVPSLGKVLSDWALVDAIEGGCMERFKTAREIRIDGKRRPFRRTIRRLISPSYIRRYVKTSSSNEEEIQHLRFSSVALLRRATEIAPRYIGRDEVVFTEYDTQLTAFRERREQMEREEERHFYGEPKYVEPPVKTRRKLLKRASKMAAGIIGAATVSALARGEKVDITGQSVVLQLQRRGRLTDKGHGVLSTRLLSLSKEPLAELCVYQDDVPAIDQAVGFALMVGSGLEQQLVDEANLTTITELGTKHTLIAERLRQEVQASRAHVTSLSAARWTHAESQAWCAVYWRKTQEVWTDAILVAVLGRNVKIVKTLVATGERNYL